MNNTHLDTNGVGVIISSSSSLNTSSPSQYRLNKSRCLIADSIKKHFFIDRSYHEDLPGVISLIICSNKPIVSFDKQSDVLINC